MYRFLLAIDINTEHVTLTDGVNSLKLATYSLQVLLNSLKHHKEYLSIELKSH